MQGLRAFWNKGLTGKLVIIGAGAGILVTVCCVLLVAVALIIPTPPKTTGQPTVMRPVAEQISAAQTLAPTEVSVPAIAALPTEMPVPTDAPLPTELPTLIPTEIPSPTPEPTSVPTDTPIPTNTPLPKQQTAQAKADATATIVALDEAYPAVDIRDLVKGPDRYKDQKLRVEGTVFNIREENGLFSGLTTVMQIWVQIPGGSDFDREAVVIRFSGALEGVFKDSYIIAYGTGAGAFEGTNALGAKVVQPAIDAETIRY